MITTSLKTEYHWIQILLNFLVLGSSLETMKKFGHDADSIYKDAVKMEKLKLGRDAYLKMLKI